MEADKFDWMDAFKEKVVLISQNYTDKEKEALSISYLLNLLERIQGLNINNEQVIWFKEELSRTISLLPSKIKGEKLKARSYRAYQNQLEKFSAKVREQFKLVRKKYYTTLWMAIGMPLGIPLGLPIGIAQGNIAIGIPLGLPIGMAIGIAIGASMDKKAEKEGRVL